MPTTRLTILLPVLFCCFAALSSAGQNRAAGNADGVASTGMPAATSAGKVRTGALSQVVCEGKIYIVLTCRDLTQSANRFDKEAVAIQDAHIQKTDFYDAYRRQIFVSDRTGRYARIFVDLYSPLSALLEKMEGKTGTLYGSIQYKPSFGSFIVTRWEIAEKTHDRK